MAEGDVDAAVAELPIIDWSGPHKDLRFVEAPVEACLLVDDLEANVLPGQEAQWVPIEGWHSPWLRQTSMGSSVPSKLPSLVAISMWRVSMVCGKAGAPESLQPAPLEITPLSMVPSQS